MRLPIIKDICSESPSFIANMTKHCLFSLSLLAALCGKQSFVQAQESLLTIVQQREQAANQNKPPLRRNTTTSVNDLTKQSENAPVDFGSKASTRPQYVKGLRGLQKQPNTDVPPKNPKIGSPSVIDPNAQSDAFAANGTGKQHIGEPNPGPNVSVIAPGLASVAPPIRNKRQENDPYAPDGVRVGNIIVSPFVGTAGGYNTNPAGATKAKGSPFYQAEGGLTAQSDWSTNSFNADLRGIYTDYTGVKGANQPEASAKIGGRIDVSRDTKIDLEAHAKLATESVSNVNLPVGVTQRPNTYTYGTSAGISQRFGNAVLSATGLIDRASFDPAKVGGVSINQADRNENIYALRLRAGYELSPGITPFVDAIVDARQFDKTVDRNGFRRSSNGLTGRLGSSFELASALTGEIALGYSTRSYADNTLKNLSGLVAEGNLIWSVSPLTAVRLRTLSQLQDTTTAGASGIVTRSVGLDVEHALLSNLTLGASTDFGHNVTQGAPQTQNFITAGLRTDYKLTKEVMFRSSYTFQKFSANYLGGSYTSNMVLFGLRLQR